MERHPASDQPAWLTPLRFTLSGKTYRYFFHYHNCGWPPSRCTERTVELALADSWLNGVDPEAVYEIGAVTPYYWPRRVRNIVDPFDNHGLVTIRRSMFDVDLRNRPVLSISTLEHIGTGQYGVMRESGTALDALGKIVQEAQAFLVTVPVGCNRDFDDMLFARTLPATVSLRFMVRQPDGLYWRQESEPAKARLAYGALWANSLAILERGTILSGGAASGHST